MSLDDARERIESLREEADEKLNSSEKGPDSDGVVTSDDGQAHGRSWSNSSETIKTD